MANKWRNVFVSTQTGDLLSKVFIRLVRPTCRNRTGYKLIACHGPAIRTSSDDDREASTIEEVGYYDENINSAGKKICLLNIAKIRSYIAEGAEPTAPVWRLLGASGAFPVHPLTQKEAAQNRYILDRFPLPTSDRTELKELPEKYPTWSSDHEEVKGVSKFSDIKGKGKKKKQDDYRRITEEEDRDNKMKGLTRVGDFKSMLRQIEEMDALDPPLNVLERNELEYKITKSFWDLNHYDESGQGTHDNFKRDKQHNEVFKDMSRMHYHWTRGVRDYGYTDPFKLVKPPALRRKGENAELLNSSNKD